MRKSQSGILWLGCLALLLVGCTGERPHNLGVVAGVLAVCPASPNCVSSQAEDEEHQIAPFTFAGEPNAAFVRLAEVLGKRSDALIIESRADYLRVELRTTFFVDDAEFLLDRERQRIELRSASRLGYSDLGKNRRRMEEIRQAFAAAESHP